MNTRIRWLKLSLLGAGALCLAALPALGDVPNGQGDQNYPEPGALNFVQGSAYLQGQQLNSRNLGSSELAPGQVLRTTEGRAEVLLTPGVFLRLDNHSAVKMISPDAYNTKIEVLQGEAGIEVDQIHSGNHLEVVDEDVTTRLAQRGFYEFFANPPRVRVFSGEAQVLTGNRNYVAVKKNHELALDAGSGERPQSFNADQSQDALFNWSKSRSQYLAEANRQYIHEYGYAGAPGWYWNPWGPGWDWDWAPGWGPGPGWGWGPRWWGPRWGFGFGWGW